MKSRYKSQRIDGKNRGDSLQGTEKKTGNETPCFKSGNNYNKTGNCKRSNHAEFKHT